MRSFIATCSLCMCLSVSLCASTKSSPTAKKNAASSTTITSTTQVESAKDNAKIAESQAGRAVTSAESRAVTQVQSKEKSASQDKVAQEKLEKSLSQEKIAQEKLERAESKAIAQVNSKEKSVSQEKLAQEKQDKKGQEKVVQEKREIKSQTQVQAPALVSAEPSAVDLDQISQSVGYYFAQQLKTSGCGFSAPKVIEGIQLAINGATPPLSEKQLEEKLTAFQESAFQKNAESNLTNANAFLEKNASQEGVKTIENKLQYTVLESGKENGKVVQQSDTPLVHYTGKLIDGVVFGSSHDPDHPIALSLQEVIPGFAKGIVGMKEGEKRRLFIHPDLGYGMSDHLPPNSLLIFDVEVIEANNAG